MAESKKTEKDQGQQTVAPAASAATSAAAAVGEREPGEGQDAKDKLAKGKGGDKEFEVAERARTIQQAVAEPTRPLAPASSTELGEQTKKTADKQAQGIVRAAGDALKEAVDQVAATASRTQAATKTYRLIHGRHYLADGSVLPVGGTTELTDAQYFMNADRFVLDETADEQMKMLKQRQDRGHVGRPIPTTHMPQDAGSKTPIHLDEGVLTPQQRGQQVGTGQDPDGANTASRQQEAVDNERKKA